MTAPRVFRIWPTLTSLEELRIETGDVLSAADLAGLERLSHLKVLEIHFAEITDDGVALLGRMSQLEELSLDPVILSRLNHLNGLTNLRRLSASHIRTWDTDVPPDEGTLDLSGLKKLRGLGLSGMTLHDEDLAFLDALPLLEGISISPTSPLPGVSLRRFAKLHHLNQLSIHGLSHCTGQDLASLNGLAELTASDTDRRCAWRCASVAGRTAESGVAQRPYPPNRSSNRPLLT